MFLLREVTKKDSEDLLKMANTPGMFNFPSTREAMAERISKSEQSFHGHPSDPKYVFVAEDLISRKVVATSMIARQHGTPYSPHYYFKVGTEKRFSSTIQTGFIHGTLTMKMQTDGPSELGALIVSKDYRNHPEKVGRQIFFTRFLYLLQNRNRFKDKLIAELLPPLNKKGHSPLWEAIGRRFTNLDYWEADLLASQNKEFIQDLFPQGKIYTAFLPADARNAIGKVGLSTEPVLHLLKRIGFEYQNEIDPFDGGPHLKAEVADLIPIKKATKVILRTGSTSKGMPIAGLIAPIHTRDRFRAVQVTGEMMNTGKSIQEFYLDSSCVDLKLIQKALKTKTDETYDFTPYF
jgi:arginine N-succinyltransferase